MNILDMVALLILGISTLTALVKGLIIELIALGSVLAGIILAVFFYQDLSVFFSAAGISGEMVSDFTSFLLIFLTAMATGSILGSCINRALKKLKVKWLDRLLGGIFGFLRGYLINSVIFLALTAFPVRKSLLLESSLADFFLAGARIIVIFVPGDLKLKFFEVYEWLT